MTARTLAALTATVVSESLLVVPSHPSTSVRLALAVIAAAGWASVTSDPRLELHPRLVTAAIVLVFGAAVAVAPRGSHDLWSYLSYGRTLSVYHHNPYVYPPNAFPHDRFAGFVSTGWRGTTSVYGPLFTGTSALLAKIAGASPLRARLAFQLLSLLATSAVLFVIWVETRSVRAVTFVGLHPVVVTAIVNGGHNDVLVGLALLVAAISVSRRRPVAGGIAAGVGLLVKASMAFGIVGIAIWLASRRRRDLGVFVASALVTTGLGYLPFGPSAVGALAGSLARTSRVSPWSPISNLIDHPVGGPATALVLVLALTAAWKFRSQAAPAVAAAAAVAAYLFAGAYVLPWYPMWAIPCAALASRSWISRLIAIHAALLVVAYQTPSHVVARSVSGVVRGLAFGLGSSAVLAMYVYGLRPDGDAQHVAIPMPSVDHD